MSQINEFDPKTVHGLYERWRSKAEEAWTTLAAIDLVISAWFDEAHDMAEFAIEDALVLRDRAEQISHLLHPVVTGG